MTDVYFFDTYAIMEILKGNPRYARFRNIRPVLTIFNLVELHYAVLREAGIELADELLERYSIYEVDVDNEVIKQANRLKHKHRSKNLSAADVIGHTTSRKLRVKILTCDKEFRGMENVEFVK